MVTADSVGLDIRVKAAVEALEVYFRIGYKSAAAWDMALTGQRLRIWAEWVEGARPEKTWSEIVAFPEYLKGEGW